MWMCPIHIFCYSNVGLTNCREPLCRLLSLPINADTAIIFTFSPPQGILLVSGVFLMAVYNDLYILFCQNFCRIPSCPTESQPESLHFYLSLFWFLVLFKKVVFITSQREKPLVFHAPCDIRWNAKTWSCPSYTDCEREIWKRDKYLHWRRLTRETQKSSYTIQQEKERLGDITPVTFKLGNP